jgi:hypothetical protein
VEQVDGMRAPQLHAIKGSGPPCTWEEPGVDNLTAEQMVKQMSGELGDFFAFKLQ